tara:strand:+ start:4345 stop:5055 length:711 start_codon:yes stop_codon:yes gene_type:complete
MSANNREYLLPRMRDAIRATDADIVAIQEIVGEHSGLSKKHQDWHTQAHFEYLADSVWCEFAYGKNAIYQQGHHGNALLSKYPFLSQANHDITQWRFSQRGLLHGVIHLEGTTHKRVHVACIHLGFLPFEQWRQIRKVVHWLKQQPQDDPLILMGDFNDWHLRIHKHLTLDVGLQEVSQYMGRHPFSTFPANSPTLPLDRIYYRGLKLDHSEVLAGEDWSQLSDHRPIFAKFLLEI